MPRLRKLRKSQKYRYNVNRKRSFKKERDTGSIKCPEIRNVWENRKTMTANLNEIGLGYDPNQVLKVSSAMGERIKFKKLLNEPIQEVMEKKVEENVTPRPKGFLMEKLEQDANALRESNFRLPKGVVIHLSYMLDRHGLNYKAMVRDDKNYDQFTWKQYRAKIRKFMNIPEQFSLYLSDRGLTKDTLQWQECDSDHDL